MKTIKYTILLLAAVTVFSAAVDAKVVSRRTTGDQSVLRRLREQQQRELERRKQANQKAIETQKKLQQQQAEARRKRIGQAEARELETREKAREAQQNQLKIAAEAEKTASEEQALLGQYDTMAKEVGMSAVQRGKLIDMVRSAKGLPPTDAPRADSAELTRLTGLHKTAVGKQKELIAAKIKTLKQKNSNAPVGAAGDSKLSDAELHKKVMGLLTPVQKRKWGGYTLAQDPDLQIEGVTLTEQQSKHIRPICNAAAGELPDETADMNPVEAAKTRKRVVQKVRMQIVFEVLTPAQRTAVGS